VQRPQILDSQNNTIFDDLMVTSGSFADNENNRNYVQALKLQEDSLYTGSEHRIKSMQVSI
jgi:hypothetical protein